MSRKHDTGARVISFGGGKGGVGKSIIAGNVAVALAESGRRVVLVDADLGAANQHTLLGVDRAPATIADFLARKVSTLDEATIQTQVPNLRLVVGSGAVPNAANIMHAQKLKLMRHIRMVEADVVVVDVGAGTSHNTVDFFDLGDARVVVATAQLTSIQNAYAFLKAAVLRMFGNLCADKHEAEIFSDCLSYKETQRIAEILTAVEHRVPDLHRRMADALSRFDVRLVGNLVSENQDIGIFRGVGRMVRDFLGLPFPLVGFLTQSRDVHESVNRRLPFLRVGGHGANARAVRAIAEALLHDLPSAVAPSGSPSPPRDRDDVTQWLRRHPRIAVAWTAALESAGRIVTVQVVDVSAGGVGIVGRQGLHDGERYNLILNHPQLKLTVATVVRNAEAGAARVGLAFVGDDDTPLRIVKVARDEAAAAGVRFDG